MECGQIANSPLKNEPTMHQIGHWMWKEINTGEWKLEHAVKFSAYLWTSYKEIYEQYHG